MYLKSLTLKGFKSFASSTTLQLEPGITCIVGPNGSGKSNVVDALAWVMGEQGAKSLRGGKMEDVIFAGTSGRPPLGRAEVQLTIDNTDGALPIDYAEVTISRTMFRNGGSEYAINGQTCRLLDVQELLSDSGIGREMHVIVGQGQLDSILHATPEDRRGFIEEAAGVLKHRKRKEKALRKLESTEGNLNRLNDLLSEIRRQLKPLGRQAEVARRASAVQAEVRDARARLLADDLVQAQVTLAQEVADESVLLERRATLEGAVEAARLRESELEAALRDDLPALAAAQETWFALSGLRERFRGTASLAAERVRNAEAQAAEPIPAGRDPQGLEAEAERFRLQEVEIAAEVAVHRADLETAINARLAAEGEASDEERRVAALQRAAADRREGVARLHGQVNALHSRAGAADEEIGRLTQRRDEAQERADRARLDFTALESRIAGLDAGEEGLDAEHEHAAAELDRLDTELNELLSELQAAERERSALIARRDALALALDPRDGAGALLSGDRASAGLLGSVASVFRVSPGFEVAVATALGAAADAVAATDLDAAIAAVGLLRDEDLGRAGLLLAGGSADRDWPALPAGAVYAVDVIDGPEEFDAAFARLMPRVAIVADVPAAKSLVEQRPDVTAVTKTGDVLSAYFVSGGSGARTSLIEAQAAYAEAGEKLEAAIHAVERLTFRQVTLTSERDDAQQRVDVALAKLHESDAALAAVAEELGQYGSQARSAAAEVARLESAIEAAREAKERDGVGLAELEERLAAAETAPDEEPDTARREELAEAARQARAAEMDARLALRTAEERARGVTGRAEALLKTAAQERSSRAAAIARRERVLREGRVGAAVLAGAQYALRHLVIALERAEVARTEVERGRLDRERELREVRESLRGLGRDLDELVSSVHRDEMARTEQRMRIEQLQERALEELGLEPDALVAEYGPHLSVPFFGELAEGEEEPPPVPFEREAQTKRLRTAERALAQLGRINPLALEEFSAMEERHKFLTEQLEDLRRTRRDLLDIVKDVDERVQQVFTEAWEDVRVAFDHVFSRLFPGGEGRLVLTDPDDMLTTGIEVEARPAGKRVKRLSLLSGGERSLVAVAFLVSLFKARPSPFYILDEVEAALDDTNLGRLLEIYEELRAHSQLLVITHQKRTMEVGDALYGVTMRGDGVSAVISQRLREAESA
ncbi:MAG: chromosome segregation protein SMC [Marmoricola sp.]